MTYESRGGREHTNTLRDRFVRLGVEIDQLTTPGRRLSQADHARLIEADAEQTRLLAEIQTRGANEPSTPLVRPEGDPVTESRPYDQRTQILSEPLTYSKYSERSFFADLVKFRGDGDLGAQERLNHHRSEMAVEMQSRPELRAMSRTDTTSVGEFVPPAWLIDDYAAALRAGRPTANLCTVRELPGGTDSLNIPTLNGGTTQATATAVQTADNATLTTQDMISNTISAPVRTIGGYADVALQVIEQSPLQGGMDALIWDDLLADYNKQLDTQVLSGSGSAGQVTGILTQTGINSITYTQASPTVVTHYPFLMQGASQVARKRYDQPTAIVMRPDRWFWFLSALDSSNRPLIVPNVNGPFNAAMVQSPGLTAPLGATYGGMSTEGGVAGFFGTVPIVLDGNIPNNVGGASNEDRIIVGRFSDALLFEGPLRVSAHPDALASSLGMRLRLYRYVAFTAGRAPVAFSTFTGTGNIVTTVLSGF
jgi:HK97 family phage major capsid protein